MVVLWHGPAEGVVQQAVLGHGAQPLFAPQHMADPHQVVVHHHRQVVGGKAVGLHQDLHVHLPPRYLDDATQAVVETASPLFRHCQTHHRAFAGGDEALCLGVGQRQTAAVVARRLAAGLLLAAQGRQPLCRAEAAERLAGGEEPVRVAPVEGLAFALPVRTALAADVRPLVPVEAQPPQRGKDPRFRSAGAAGLIGVLDAQHELAAVALRQGAVEECHVGRAHMGISGGTGRDAGAYRRPASGVGVGRHVSCPRHRPRRHAGAAKLPAGEFRAVSPPKGGIAPGAAATATGAMWVAAFRHLVAASP